jgi:hypothetical protein
MNYSDAIMKDGKKRLKRLLPQAMKTAKKTRLDENYKVEKSHMASVLVRQAKPGNLVGIMVYRTEKGWYADLVLRNVGQGNSNVMGTPVDHPHMDKSSAEKAGLHILITALIGWMDAKEQAKIKPTADERVFKLHGHEFSIPGEIIDTVSEAWELYGTKALGDDDDARARIIMNLTEMMGGDAFDPDIWDAAPRIKQMQILANMATLLVFGHPFHPEKSFPDPIPDTSIH